MLVARAFHSLPEQELGSLMIDGEIPGISQKCYGASFTPMMNLFYSGQDRRAQVNSLSRMLTT
jgi:hypothetical protein